MANNSNRDRLENLSQEDNLKKFNSMNLSDMETTILLKSG